MESAGMGNSGDCSCHALFGLPVGDGSGKADQKDDGGGYHHQGVRLQINMTNKAGFSLVLSRQKAGFLYKY